METRRPTPETIGDLAEICLHVTYAGPLIELCNRALLQRMKNHCGDLDWNQLPPDVLARPIEPETQEIFEEIRKDWIRFREAMIKVFGE